MNPYENNTTEQLYNSYTPSSDRKASVSQKKKTAVALGYDPGDAAPKIIASGQGAVAERIIEGAKEHQIPLHKDERLANTLSRLEIGECIPPQLYEVVAQVLLFVDRLDRIKEKVQKDIR